MSDGRLKVGDVIDRRWPTPDQCIETVVVETFDFDEYRRRRNEEYERAYPANRAPNWQRHSSLSSVSRRRPRQSNGEHKQVHRAER